MLVRVRDRVGARVRKATPFAEVSLLVNEVEIYLLKMDAILGLSGSLFSKSKQNTTTSRYLFNVYYPGRCTPYLVFGQPYLVHAKLRGTVFNVKLQHKMDLTTLRLKTAQTAGQAWLSVDGQCR